METGENNIKPLKLITTDLKNLDTEKHHLSVEIGLEDFSYALLNIENLEYKRLFHYNIKSNLDIKEIIQNISEIYNKEKLFRKIFSSQSLAFTTFPNTLVPCNTFIEGKELDILKLNHEVFDTVLKDKLKNVDAYNIYSVPKEMLEMVKIFFPEIKIRSRSSTLIDGFLNNNSNQEIFLLVNNTTIEIIAFNNGKLLLQNIFTYSTKEDILYYLLSSMEALELSVEKCRVTLFGNIKKNEGTFNLLYEYIRNISFAKRSKKFKYCKEFEDLDDHQFLPLLTQILCV